MVFCDRRNEAYMSDKNIGSETTVNTKQQLNSYN